MYVPDLLIVGCEILPCLAPPSWSPGDCFWPCCCHFHFPFLCLHYLEVLGGGPMPARSPPTIEILLEKRCDCRQSGTWWAASSVPWRYRLRAPLPRVRERQPGGRPHLRRDGAISFSPSLAAPDFQHSSRTFLFCTAGDLIPWARRYRRR